MKKILYILLAALPLTAGCSREENHEELPQEVHPGTELTEGHRPTYAPDGAGLNQ